jgi:hypothetical protein
MGLSGSVRRTASSSDTSAVRRSSMAECLVSVSQISTLRQPSAASIGRTMSSLCCLACFGPHSGLTNTSTRLPRRDLAAAFSTCVTHPSAP